MLPALMHFYFDIRDGDDFACDEIGTEMSDVSDAKKLAARELMALAPDMSEGLIDRKVTYEVRDGLGIDVFRMSLSFEVSEAPQSLDGPKRSSRDQSRLTLV